MPRKKKPTPVRVVTLQRADRTAEPVAIACSPAAAARVLQPLIGDKDREHFAVLHLDARHQVVAAEVVAVGTLTACLVHPREVFKAAIVNGAGGIICGHNHPSGQLEPSSEDVAIEQRLREAGTLLGIEMLDFVIVSEHAYWSRREQSI